MNPLSPEPYTLWCSSGDLGLFRFTGGLRASWPWTLYIPGLLRGLGFRA